MITSRVILKNGKELDTNITGFIGKVEEYNEILGQIDDLKKLEDSLKKWLILN